MNARHQLSSLFLAVLSIFNTAVDAQVEIRDPVYLSRKNNFVTINKVTITPNTIRFHLLYEPGRDRKWINNSQFYSFNSPPYLRIEGVTAFKLTDGTVPRGQQASAYTQNYGAGKPPKTRELVADFPFNSGRMIFNIQNEQYTKWDNTLMADFTECAPKYPIKQIETTCMDFKTVVLPLSDKHIHLLNLTNHLKAALKKTEFETTTGFQARTSPDSMLHGLMAEIDQLEDVFYTQATRKILSAKTTLTYNADRQVFSLVFPGASVDPVQIEVPLDKAQAFKARFQDGSLKIADIKLNRRTDREFYISSIDFRDKQSHVQTFRNLHDSNQSADWKKAYVREILKELEKFAGYGKKWSDGE